MIEIDIPGHRTLRLAHLVLDYNGTLARDGYLLEGVGERLSSLAGKLDVHVVTADTFGNAREGLGDLPCELVILPPGSQDTAKADYVMQLGAGSTAAIGNGRNDLLMLGEASLGIGVILDEGAASGILSAADVVCACITDALDLLIHPMRLIATLRS